VSNDEIDEQENIQKRVAYYKVLLSAWVDNRMEFDRRIMTLSSVAVGFLVANRDDIDHCCLLIIWVAANILFITSVALSLAIFHFNSNYIEEFGLSEPEGDSSAVEEYSNHHGNLLKTERRLRYFTFCSALFFVLGIVLVAIWTFLSLYFRICC